MTVEKVEGNSESELSSQIMDLPSTDIEIEKSEPTSPNRESKSEADKTNSSSLLDYPLSDIIDDPIEEEQRDEIASPKKEPENKIFRPRRMPPTKNPAVSGSDELTTQTSKQADNLEQKSEMENYELEKNLQSSSTSNAEDRQTEYYCCKEFKATSSMDLNLTVGDIVIVTTMDDSNFYYGHLKSDKSVTGMFHRGCIIEVGSQEYLEIMRKKELIETGKAPVRPARTAQMSNRVQSFATSDCINSTPSSSSQVSSNRGGNYSRTVSTRTLKKSTVNSIKKSISYAKKKISTISKNTSRIDEN